MRRHVTGVSRLLAAPGPGLADHLAHLDAYSDAPTDEIPTAPGDLISLITRAGLSGRGGAGFPTGRKMAAITGKRPVVVGNGAEGEPLSRKDATLLRRAPHLVLDGLDAAARAVGADAVHLYVPAEVAAVVAEALAERRAAGLRTRRVAVVEAPDRFVAGEESAVIRRIEGGPALPRDRTAVSAVAGVRGRPTLVNNVETLAHIALISRFGSDWFRSVGDPDDPGTMLVTLSGVLDPVVVEVPTGVLITDLLARTADTGVAVPHAVLIGGYHGTWLRAEELTSVRLSRTALGPLGAAPGAGIVHALDRSQCGLRRTAEITAYLAGQSARQCGPCLNGLPRLAGLLDELATGAAGADPVPEIHRLAGLVDGRGSCRHPDGTARMVRSALRTFADEVELHRHGHCCLMGAPVAGG
ncbi:MAG: NADH-quinone oxidoreductase subunit F [Mycobacterium sp.]|nr:NADH-quinone oxidoreductase subunit F [Mycobacterium sp.]